MLLRHALDTAIAAALTLAVAPASAQIVTVTLTGNTENVRDNTNVFGQGVGTLTNLPFVETLLINTAVGVDSSGGYSSNSIFNANPPFAVSGSLVIGNGPAFTVAGSNYSGAHSTVTNSSNPFFSSTSIDLNLNTDDSVGPRLDNQLYVDLSGANLPTSLTRPITVALTPGEIGNVSFTDEVSGNTLPNAIGNLFPTTLRISIAGAVPEPATWLSMILGFALVGVGLRRRRTADAAFA